MADSDTDADATPGREDLPFFYAFTVLGMAAILIPEARAVLYYGFLRMDFLHSRLSVAMTLPLAILATMFLGRFLPVAGTRQHVRWFAGGILFGLVLWLLREATVGPLTTTFGPALESLRPQRLLTSEAIRVVSSLLLVIAACTALVWRVRAPTLPLVGGIVACWMGAETLLTTENRINGPQVTAQERPFQNLDYLQVPPGEMRIPTSPKRAALRERLEVDRYRAVLIQDREQFLALAEPHLSAFWDLRLVEGYSTGLPRRLAALPWAESMVASHHLDIYRAHQIERLPWRLLAALNVKYAVVVDQALWFNPAPGGPNPPLDIGALRIVENPNPVTPRAFFAARVSPAGETPRLSGDNGRRPPPDDPPIAEPASQSVAENWTAERQFPVDGLVDATFDGDRVTVRVDPAAEDRFLILNELFHPSWQARIDGVSATIYPTNLVMRGVLVPAGATVVEFHFVPFIATPAAGFILLGGLAMAGGIVGLGLWLRRRGPGIDLATHIPVR